MDVAEYMAQMGRQARLASREAASADTGTKNAALEATARALEARRDEIAEANAKDLANGKEKGLEAALLDRLELTPARFNTMLEGLQQVAGLPDPVGAISGMNYRPSGIQVGKMRVTCLSKAVR